VAQTADQALGAVPELSSGRCSSNATMVHSAVQLEAGAPISMDALLGCLSPSCKLMNGGCDCGATLCLESWVLCSGCSTPVNCGSDRSSDLASALSDVDICPGSVRLRRGAQPMS
jgi:hypothetical protein